ncbi:Hypothetical_protein [Hexamita inflata]|uniref:Hypothetical_protein n=1 Tax=Hexamita inflata TaxID=28002 RepID=A0AA86UKX3_9EUKA|nr:Hypothetical protein HINF_LOCUS43111 [Hexamita inflata]
MITSDTSQNIILYFSDVRKWRRCSERQHLSVSRVDAVILQLYEDSNKSVYTIQFWLWCSTHKRAENNHICSAHFTYLTTQLRDSAYKYIVIYNYKQQCELNHNFQNLTEMKTYTSEVVTSYQTLYSNTQSCINVGPIIHCNLYILFVWVLRFKLSLSKNTTRFNIFILSHKVRGLNATFTKLAAIEIRVLTRVKMHTNVFSRQFTTTIASNLCRKFCNLCRLYDSTHIGAVQSVTQMNEINLAL